MKYFSAFLFCMITCIVFSGCGTPKGYVRDPDTDQLISLKDPPQQILTIHEYVEYPRAQDDEMLLTSTDTKQCWVVKRALFHSSVVKQIYPVESDTDSDFFDLRLKLTDRGERWWNNMIDDYYDKKLIIALDGQKIAEFVAKEPAEIDDDEVTKLLPFMEKPGWVRIHGPFHASLVDPVCKQSKRNYLYYDYYDKERIEHALDNTDGKEENIFDTDDSNDKASKLEGSGMFEFKNLFKLDN